MKFKLALGAILALSACASLTVSDGSIAERTAAALGLEASQITITDRVNDGTSARYKVQTSAGQKFNCTVGGSLSILGASTTDAICTPVSADGKVAAGATCNALLKAANKC